MVYSFKGMTWHEPHISYPMISMLQVAQTKIWCYGPETDGANLVVDSTVGVQYLIEIKDAMGFLGDDWLTHGRVRMHGFLFWEFVVFLGRKGSNFRDFVAGRYRCSLDIGWTSLWKPEGFRLDLERPKYTFFALSDRGLRSLKLRS